jgi:putative transcriptional regulator
MTNLSNHFLIAMPSVNSAMFGASVIYLTDHSTINGAVGVIINKPLGKVVSDTFEDIKFANYNPTWMDSMLYLGGTSKTDDGFILHRSIGTPQQKFELTNDKYIVSELAKYKSKEDVFIAMGYSSWASCQLEVELRANVWLVLKGDDRLIFDIDPVNRYDEAMRMLGVSNIGKLYCSNTIIA